MYKYPFIWQHFQGCYLFHHFNPRVIKEGNFVILYQEPAILKHLGHWVLLLKNYRDWEYFDSSGENFETPEKKAFSFKLRAGGCLFSQTFPLQPSRTVTCGHFCLYFIANRLLNMLSTYDDFLVEVFSAVPEVNEQSAASFYNWICEKR